jgi:hypothetical protein
MTLPILNGGIYIIKQYQNAIANCLSVPVHKFSKDLHIALYLLISDYTLFLSHPINETLI